MFKIMGAAAAAANLLLEFKIPEKKDERLTNNRKGNSHTVVDQDT